MKNENIVRYTTQEILELNLTGRTGTDWERINSMSEEEITRLAFEENEALGIEHDWYESAYPSAPLDTGFSGGVRTGSSDNTIQFVFEARSSLRTMEVTAPATTPGAEALWHYHPPARVWFKVLASIEGEAP